MRQGELQQLQNEDLRLQCAKRIHRDMTKLDQLGRRWVDCRRSSSLFIARYFRLKRIVRDAIADYNFTD